MSPEVNSAQSQPKDQVPRRKRFLWGLGGFTDATITYGLNGMVNVIYINALAVNAVLVSVACAIPRFLDFITDPLIGFFQTVPVHAGGAVVPGCWPGS